VKLVHAADLHVDSPMRGLERYEGAPVEAMRTATRRALENLVELCLEEGAALLLLAGDLFDGDWKDYSTGLFFAKQMSRLREADVRVVWIRGNHDAASHINKHLTLPENVHELSHKRPETLELEHLGIAVHGQGFAKRSIQEDLAASYPDALPGWLNVGLLHTSLTGREGHDEYAPCSLETLVGKGYDYWALGHVHRREVVCEAPWVVFPGNLQGRHAREPGAKGATLITAEGGRVLAAEHRPLDAARWIHLAVGGEEASHPDDLLDAVRTMLAEQVAAADGRPLAARVTVTGRSPAHERLLADRQRWESELRASANDLGDVWLEKVLVATHGTADVSAPGFAQRDDAMGQIAVAIDRMQYDDERLASMVEALGDLHKRLPRELRASDRLALHDPEALRRMLPEVEQLLLARLLGGRE
jgi:DNA repair exonuclease SbcCD nuclease subunit